MFVRMSVRSTPFSSYWAGVPTGATASGVPCNRDFALVQGFNPGVELTRTQTIMEGATHCDFRFVRRR